MFPPLLLLCFVGTLAGERCQNLPEKGALINSIPGAHQGKNSTLGDSRCLCEVCFWEQVFSDKSRM
ncbi:hypothetical protein HU200_028649 [Digitaria exilis]|uniref:Uncharacterized protein n=1 Tax=Digitaria exilis TaxID=1010633 RepID=A0A835ESP9_9POAL|nr:hypothetical protein HU200_028649 [Digitaria exilis]